MAQAPGFQSAAASRSRGGGSVRRLCLPVILLLVAMLVPVAPPAAAGGGPLFAPAAAPSARSADPHGVRERFVTVDTDLLLAGRAGRTRPATVVLNLFDDVSVGAVGLSLDVRGPERFTWAGRVGESGTAVLTVEDGLVVGRVSDPRWGSYTVTPVGEGVHRVVEVDPGSYPVEDDALTGPVAPAPGAGPVPRAEGPVTISVLVVYTRATAGDLGGKAAAVALAENMVAETNRAFEASGVVPRLELAAARQVDYREADESRPNLDRLTNPRDGYLDEVQTWRNELGADLVFLVVAPMSDNCGSAWIMLEADQGFANLAFGVVSYDCAVGNLSFAHEVGHLLGANHEEVQGQVIFPFAYAWVDCEHGFRTIMAYGLGCATQPPRIAQFSSPDHPYSGWPAGDARHDNARVLNRTGPVAALFRRPPPLCAGRRATIVGTAGADRLEGTHGPDVIHALGGDDVIYGLAGDDVICGGAGNDVISGGFGVNELYGGPGDDRFTTGAAGTSGTLDGGIGRDRIGFSKVMSTPVVGDLATGLFSAGGGSCTLRRVEEVVGSPLGDTITGDGRRNVLLGGAGNDSLSGGAGDDRLDGGAGDDILRGDAGADRLQGGTGNDLLFGDAADLPPFGGPGEDSCAVGSAAPAPC